MCVCCHLGVGEFGGVAVISEGAMLFFVPFREISV
jgi:hypothetical protein